MTLETMRQYLVAHALELNAFLEIWSSRESGTRTKKSHSEKIEPA